MEAKHTPGPWSAEFGEAVRVRATDGSSVCHITWLTANGRRDGNEGECNARLIAAAPDLLEAAQQIACASYVISGSPELTQLRAAIAKATGSAA